MNHTKTIVIALLFVMSIKPAHAAGDDTKSSSMFGMIDKQMLTTMGNFALSGLATGAGIGIVVSALSQIKKAIIKRANTQIGVIKINDLSKSDQYIKDLQVYVRDSTVKAILLMINCNDGSMAVANLLYNELLEIKKIKPIVALLDYQCSAAAYYVALASDDIIAPPLARISAFNVQHCYTYITNPRRIILDGKHLSILYGDAQEEMITSNKLSAASQYCALTEQERLAQQKYSAACYEQFCLDVSAARQLSLDAVYGYAQVPLFTGLQAYALKLIDHIGTFTDAKNLIKKVLQLRHIWVTGSMIFLYPKESVFPFDILESIPKPVLDMMSRIVQGVKTT